MEDINDPIVNCVETNPLRKNLAGLIDAAIVIVLYMGIAFCLRQSILTRIEPTILPLLLIIILFALHRLFFMIIANSTMGMRIFKIELLNDDLESLTLKEKIFASFFILINGVAYYNRTA